MIEHNHPKISPIDSLSNACSVILLKCNAIKKSNICWYFTTLLGILAEETTKFYFYRKKLVFIIIVALEKKYGMQNKFF